MNRKLIIGAIGPLMLLTSLVILVCIENYSYTVDILLLALALVGSLLTGLTIFQGINREKTSRNIMATRVSNAEKQINTISREWKLIPGEPESDTIRQIHRDIDDLSAKLERITAQQTRLVEGSFSSAQPAVRRTGAL